MCGVVEAALVVAVVGAIAGHMASENLADAQTAQNKKIDDVAYAGYKSQLNAIDRKQAQERRQIGAKQFEQSVEVKQTQGRTSAELDQMGLGQHALAGRSPDAIMHDIQFQRGVGQARLKQYETDMFAEMSSNREMAYLSYQAKNSQLPLVQYPSMLETGIKIAEAGLGYYENPNRKTFGSDFRGTTGHTASQYNSMSNAQGVPW